MRKLSYAVILLLFVVLAGLVIPEPVLAAIGQISGKVVNVRSGPAISYPKKGTVVLGDKVQIVQQKGNWVKISTAKISGWVSGTYVKVISESTNSSSSRWLSTSGSLAKITGSIVNLRSGPGTNYKIVTKATKGQQFSLLGSEKGWYKISAANGTAYVADWLAEVVKPVTQPAASEPVLAAGSYIEVTGNVVNLRSGPGTGFSKVGTVVRGQHLSLLGTEKGWYKVLSSNGVISYLAGWLARAVEVQPAMASDIQPDDNSNLDSPDNGTNEQTDAGLPEDDPASLPDNVVDPAGDDTLPPDDNTNNPADKQDINNSAPSQRIYKVVLDPGHGGKDPGALGATGSQEKDINLSIAWMVEQRLSQIGYSVVMTRSSDITVDLYQRPEIANANSANVFVSIHANANKNRSMSGTTVYYYAGDEISQEQSQVRRTLADLIHTNLVNSLGLFDNGVRQGGYVVVKYTTMPSVLIETAYISNPDEEVLLNDPGFQARVADAITQGIHQYFYAGVSY